MKVHLAISVSDVAASVAEYTRMLGCAPERMIPDEYALWRTKVLNLSIRKTGEEPGRVRHVGFERDDAPEFLAYTDRDGLMWETFNKEHQAEEIRAVWGEGNDDGN